MIFLSTLLDVASRIGGPRFAFRLQLLRWQRWRNVEAEWLILDRLVDPTRAAVDVGTNFGLYAGRLAQLCPHVHCFEPIPWLAIELASRLPRRGVTIHQIALSNQHGTAELRIPYDSAGEEHNGLSTLEAVNSLGGRETIRVVQCEIEQLDAVVRQPVGFIKIDVEGHELAVLQGAHNILQRDRPTLLVESQSLTNAAAPGNVISFLASLGYTGHFYAAAKHHDIADFDPELHQNPRNMGNECPYVNNFIFTRTASAAAALPMALPR